MVPEKRRLCDDLVFTHKTLCNQPDLEANQFFWLSQKPRLRRFSIRHNQPATNLSSALANWGLRDLSMVSCLLVRYGRNMTMWCTPSNKANAKWLKPMFASKLLVKEAVLRTRPKLVSGWRCLLRIAFLYTVHGKAAENAPPYIKSMLALDLLERKKICLSYINLLPLSFWHCPSTVIAPFYLVRAFR